MLQDIANSKKFNNSKDILEKQEMNTLKNPNVAPARSKIIWISPDAMCLITHNPRNILNH